MTGEQFVKLCYEEKKTILAEYFNPNSSSVVGKKISAITEQGISKDDLYDLLNLVLKEITILCCFGFGRRSVVR